MGARLRQVKPRFITPGMNLVVKTRILVEGGGRRTKAPVDVCRVLDVPLPDPKDYGEQTIIPVEFLYCDQ